MRHIAMVIGLSVVMLLPRVASAWNETGHMVIALIAWQKLDDAHRQQITKILKSHPHDALYLTADRPKNVSEDEWAFLRASAWPDYVRPSRPGSPEGFKGRDITQYHHPQWHYIDLPIVAPDDRNSIDKAKLPPPLEPNVLTEIAANEKILSSTDSKPEERAIALAWVEHLVGDVHQPLHAVSEFSNQFPAGDKGGNAQAVRVNGAVMNLHAVWDDALGNSGSYYEINFLARRILDDPRLAPDKLSELARDKTAADWANESRDAAMAMVYLDGRLRSARFDAYIAREVAEEDVPALPASYMVNAHDLSMRRAALAGYRLAGELKRLIAVPKP